MSSVDRIGYFDTKYAVDERGCWVWTAARDPQGYGRFGVSGGRSVLAHRWSYEHHVGPIPDGYHVDHLCLVRACVNPGHLEAVTPGENNRRMTRHRVTAQEKRTHCAQGHEYTVENTRRDGRGHRHCRACDAALTQRVAEQRRLARIARYGFDPGPRARWRPEGTAHREHA